MTNTEKRIIEAMGGVILTTEQSEKLNANIKASNKRAAKRIQAMRNPYSFSDKEINKLFPKGISNIQAAILNNISRLD